MAKQVRPWLAKPVRNKAPRVRVSDRGANQQIPSGTAAKKPHLKSECTGAIFTFEPSLIESLANRGRPCTFRERHPCDVEDDVLRECYAATATAWSVAPCGLTATVASVAEARQL